MRLIEQYLGPFYPPFARELLPCLPEELILPHFKVICFVEEGQDAREHSDAIKSMFLRGKI